MSDLEMIIIRLNDMLAYVAQEDLGDSIRELRDQLRDARQDRYDMQNPGVAALDKLMENL